MKVYENQCVGCPPEIGCLGNTCPYVNVPVYCCDNKNGHDIAVYRIDGQDLCEDCTKSLLLELFNELDIEEKAQLLGINLHEIGET